MKIFYFLILSFSFSSTYAQSFNENYNINAEKADELFLKGDFKGAITFYQKAFNSNKGIGKVIHRYNLASCWVADKQIDSAFYQLQRIVDKGMFSGYDLITMDANFFKLHNDIRWEPLVRKIKANEEKRLKNKF